MGYPTPDTRLLGFPFLTAAFEHSATGGWVDFVGLRTLPATVGNFAVGFFYVTYCSPLRLGLAFGGTMWPNRSSHREAEF